MSSETANPENSSPSAPAVLGVPKVCEVSTAYISRLPNEPETRALQVPVEFQDNVEDTVNGPHGHGHLFKWTLAFVQGDPEADGRFLRRQSELVASLRTEEQLLASVQEAIDKERLDSQEEGMFVWQASDSLTDEKLYREASVRWLKRELNVTGHHYMLAKSIAGTKAQQMAAAAAATEAIQPQPHGADPAQHSQGVMEDVFSALFGEDQIPQMHQLDNTESYAKLVSQIAQYVNSGTFGGFQTFGPDMGAACSQVQAITDDLREMVGSHAYSNEDEGRKIVRITNMLHNKRWNEQQVDRLDLAHKVAFVVKTLRLRGEEYDDWIRAHPHARVVREAIENAAEAEASANWGEM